MSIDVYQCGHRESIFFPCGINLKLPYVEAMHGRLKLTTVILTQYSEPTSSDKHTRQYPSLVDKTCNFQCIQILLIWYVGVPFA